MKILITGANGQLGRDLVEIIGLEHDVIGFGREELDICDLEQCRSVINKEMPNLIIHAAAYTAVDLAESEEDLAFRINAFGTRNVTMAAEEINAKLCYVSTDYVFDGRSESSYKEYDNTNPQSIYGKSKHAGELLVQSLSNHYFIVRTSWVYGQYGNNFVKTMLKLGKEKPNLKVVDDQIGSPTYTIDLCQFILELIASEKYGIYHASNSGSCSWFDFAKAIFSETDYVTKVEPCTTDEFPRPAPRPRHSVMDHQAIRSNNFTDLRPWREALKEFLISIK
ncbi:dTDP-4-dehydrorhamnose reductase [Paenibacillus psychroresistens]|uniref:dTDP-4-dehydrorhamnose reductase n=1 Tax=Paenibacillus psychroresistens TaxID=1778678 RepID=A0A6B8RRH9_9BACL|nr:dTDP-4-dehydrorhamnose reductase [Paenibacillus psychroresistens]QGQ98467.1 dTDP-4-dehydrorhamnose reductase [Paenibacillus psychroresistens]